MKALQALLARVQASMEDARLALLRRRMHRCGRNVILYPHVLFHGPEALDIGDNTSVASFVHIWCGGRVVIGSDCMIGSHVAISSLTHDHAAPDMRYTMVAKPVNIEDGVWIGSHAVILPGVTLGKGAVVGAGSVVTRDVPAGAIVHGVPARVQAFRDGEGIDAGAASSPAAAGAASEAAVPSHLQTLRHVLSAAPGSTAGIAIDVGAHVGRFAHTLLDAGLVSSVVAFEPNPANLPELEALAARDPRLRVVRSAVGAAAGTLQLHCDRDTATGSLLSYDTAYRTDGAVTRVPVEVVTLDEFRSRASPGDARVSVLKIDTQGHDLAVLQGARALLATDRPVVIAEMIHVPLYEGQARPAEIEAFMRAAGYELYTVFNLHANAEGRLAFADALFVPAELQVPASQSFVQLDNHESYETQIRTLEQICRERLAVIEVLDAEVKRRSR